MKTHNWSSLDDLVFDQQEEAKQKYKSSKNTILKLGQKIVNGLDDLDDRWAKLSTYSEPKISEGKNRYGKTYFRVFDFEGDHYIYFNSEEEARWWSDELHY